MSQRVVALCMLAAACGGVAAQAAPAPTRPPPIAWSPVVAGMRGRLVATATADAAGKPQLQLDLELENVSDVATPIAISWASLGSMVQLSLEDEAGKPLERDAVGGNSLDLPPYWLQLPVESTLKVTISKAAYEYVPSGLVMLRPLTFQAWDLPRKPVGKLYLRGKLVPSPSTDPAHHAWVGPIVLPRVALP